MITKQHSENFIAWVQRELDERRWDQVTLAKHMGITPAGVSRVLKGERQPGLEFLQGFAKATNYKLKDVFIGAGWLPDEKSDKMSQNEIDMVALFNTLDEVEQAMILRVMRGLIALRAK